MTVLAALMQAVRTAAQKRLNAHMTAAATTYVRAVFGLPIMVAWLLAVLVWVEPRWPQPTANFLVMALAGAVTQVLATVTLIVLFQKRSFASATALTKADTILTALIGWLAFSEQYSAPGIVALAVVFCGVAIVMLPQAAAATTAASTAADSAPRTVATSRHDVLTRLANISPVANHMRRSIDSPAMLAFLVALLFSLSYQFIREATLALAPGPSLWRGAWTVVVVTGLQLAGLSIWFAVRRERAIMAGIVREWRLATFVGVTSAIGSIAWFAAFALENAAYVRAVGQIEMAFTMLISAFYFRERLRHAELAGIAVIVLGVVMFRLAG